MLFVPYDFSIERILNPGLLGHLDPVESSPNRSTRNGDALTVDEIEWFKNRILDEEEHQKINNHFYEQGAPYSELCSTRYSLFQRWKKEEQAFIGVSRLYRKGFFSETKESQTLDITNPEHQRDLKIGLIVFGDEANIAQLQPHDQFKALQILSAYEDNDNVKPNQGQQPFFPDNSTRQRLINMLKSSSLGRSLLAGVDGVYALGECIGLVATQDPVSQEQFNKIYNGKYSPEDIPRILNGGLNLDVNLKVNLLSEYTQYQQSQISTDAHQIQESDSEARAETCSNIANLLETAKNLEYEIPQEVLKEMTQRYEQALPTEQEFKAQNEEAEKLVRERTKTWRQQEIQQAVSKVAQEVGQTVHTWVQWGIEIDHRKARLDKTSRQVCSYLKTLGIKDLSEFRNKPLRSVQSLIEYKIIEAEAKGMDTLRAVTDAYQKDVRRTREAIHKCLKQNEKLDAIQNNLKGQADRIIAHEKRIEKHHRKMAKGIRGVNVIFNGLKIAGTIASVIPGGQTAGFTMAQAGQAGSSLACEANYYNNLRWDSHFNYCQEQLSSVIGASEMVYGVHSNLQRWHDALQGRREEQEDYLLKNPQMFRSHARLRSLREAVKKITENIMNLDAAVSQIKEKTQQYSDQMLTNQALHANAVKLSHTERGRNRRRNKAAADNYQRNADVCASEKESCVMQADQISFKKEDERARLDAFLAELAKSEEIIQLPAHHKEQANSMSPQELLRSSNAWLNTLEKREKNEADTLDRMNVLLMKKESHHPFQSLGKESKEKLNSIRREIAEEKLFNIKVQRTIEIEQLQNVSNRDLFKLIPHMRYLSGEHQTNLRKLIHDQQRIRDDLFQQEMECAASVDQQKKELELLSQSQKSEESANSGPTDNKKEDIQHRIEDAEDDLTDATLKRQKQNQFCRVLTEQLRQEESFCDVQLWDLMSRLPLEQRLQCAETYLDYLKLSYEKKKHTTKSLHEEKENCLISLRDSAISNEQKNSKIKHLQRIGDETALSQSEEKTQGDALRREKLRYCSLGHAVEIELWDNTSEGKRSGLLKNLFLNAFNRANIIAKTKEEWMQEQILLDKAKTETKHACEAANSRLQACLSNPNASEASKREAQNAVDEAEYKYRKVKTLKSIAVQEKSRCDEFEIQNKKIADSLVVSAYADEMQSILTLSKDSFRSYDPNERALFNQFNYFVKEFERDNPLKHIADLSETISWFAERMRNEAFSPDERKKRERSLRTTYYIRTAASVATMGASMFAFNQLVQKRLECKNTTLNPSPPNFNWKTRLLEMGVTLVQMPLSSSVGQIQLALQTIGMVASSYQMWNGDRNCFGPNMADMMDHHFGKLTDHLNFQVGILQKQHVNLADSVKVEMNKLSSEMGHLSELVKGKFERLEVKVEAGHCSSQRDLLAQEIANFHRNCRKSRAWLEDPEDEDISWLSKYLATVDCFLVRASDSDIIGSNKAELVDNSTVISNPHHFVGLLGRPLGIKASSMPLFNTVADSLLVVGRTAHQRGLPNKFRESILKRVIMALHQAEQIRSLADHDHNALNKACSALENLREGNFLLKARTEREALLVKRVEQSLKECNSVLAALEECTHRFSLNESIHELNFDQSSLKSEIKSLITGSFYWPPPSNESSTEPWPESTMPDDEQAERISTIFSKILSKKPIGRYFEVRAPIERSEADAANNKQLVIEDENLREERIWTTRRPISEAMMNSQIKSCYLSKTAIGIEIDFTSKTLGNRTFFTIINSRLSYLGSLIYDGAGLCRRDSNKSLQRTFMENKSSYDLKGTIGLVLDSFNTIHIILRPDSLIQKDDLPRIKKINWKHSGIHYNNAASFNKRNAELFRCVKEVLVLRENTPPSNPLLHLVKDSTFIPPAKSGMIPIAIPKIFMDNLLEKISGEMALLHFINKGTLLPFYEFESSHYSEAMTFSILFRYCSPKGKETDFCRFKGIFSIDGLTAKALGRPGVSFAKDSRYLIYVMYAGLMELGMPGNGSYELSNKKGVAPVDYPFEGFYMKMHRHVDRGISFKTYQFNGDGEYLPERWFAPFQLEFCPSAQKIINKALNKHLPVMEERARNLPEFKMYQESFNQALALAAMKNSLAVQELQGIDGKMIVEDVPALESLMDLFVRFGFPIPDQTFKPFDEMLKMTEPDSTRLLRQLKQYPLTVAYKEFLNKFADLITLKNLLETGDVDVAEAH